MIRRTAAAVFAATALLLSGCSALPGAAADDTVTLDFFQFKAEAKATFDHLIAGFEKTHPHIRVEQHQVPDSETAIRTRLVKGDVPDVLTLNGNGTFGELASAGVFHDFSGDPAAKNVTPGIQQVLDDLGTAAPGETDGLPLASNANGVIYNKDLFAKYHVEIPQTWNELLAAAETFQKAGVTPFYGTLKDAWTALPAFNQFAADIPPDDFWKRREAGGTSFREAYPEIAKKLTEIYRYTQKTRMARGYNDGNKAFAEGEAAMYMQGSYSLPAIRAFEPDFAMGVFPLPVTGDPARNDLVSGVDVALTMGRHPDHPEESLEFIRYLMQPRQVMAYAEEQSAVPTLRGTRPPDPALAQLTPSFDSGRITGYADHHVPAAVGLDRLLQQYLIDHDAGALLTSMDTVYDDVLARRS